MWNTLHLRETFVKSFDKISSTLVQDDSEVIFLGPWMGEIGPELQYWIPYLLKLNSAGVFRKKRILTVSRGDVKTWYHTFPNEYIETFDYISEKEFKKIRAEAIRINKLQKQLEFTPGEQFLIQRIAEKNNIKKYTVSHPSLMWKEIIPYLQEKISLSGVMEKLTFRKFSNFDQKQVAFVDKLNLPKRFISVKFYENAIFPAGRENYLFVKDVVRKINQKYMIVLLGMKNQLDKDKLFNIPDSKGIIDLLDKMPLDSNLGIQTEILRRSEGFVGTNGGFSVLPAFLNKPCLSFYRRPLQNYLKLHHQHETVTEKIYEQLNNYSYSAVSTKSWKNIQNIFA